MKKMTVYEMCVCALFTALLCVLGPIAVPIGPVPVTLGLLVIYLSVYLLGCRGTVISTVLYLLLGMVGLPVFSGYSGGLAKLAGATGGYLIGFIFVALIGGFVAEKSAYNIWKTGAALVAGTLVAYGFGTAWFVIITQNSIVYALTVCVLPFIGFDAIKIVLATAFGKAVRVALTKAHLIPGVA